MLLFSLLACSRPPGAIALGDVSLTIEEDGALTLVRNDPTGEPDDTQPLFATAPGAAMQARTFEETVETNLGIWRFERSDETQLPFGELTDVDRDTNTLTFTAEDGTTASLLVSDQGESTRFLFTPDVEADSVAIPVRCDADSTFHGFGEQYHVTDQHGELPFELFLSEQGIGRDGELFGLSGNRHTTYFPMPYWLDARGFGVLFETDYRTNVDLCSTDAGIAWIEPVETGPIAWTVFHGPTPADVIRQLGDVVGRPTAPPDWAWGTWIMTQGGPDEVLAQLDAVEAANIPATSIWVQDWTGTRQNLGGGFGVQYRYEPDLDYYPEIATFFEDIHQRGYKITGYVNPFVDPALQHWDEMEAMGMLPVDPESGETCTFFGPRGDMTQADLSNPATQEYIKGFLRTAVVDVGLDGWMADFAEWLPLDCDIHEGDPRAFHNRYPEAWQRLTREVMDEVRPDGDWVMYARSGWTGVHSVAQIHWAGDQEADFEETDGLPTVVPAMLTLSLSGQPFVTHDIAGFSGGPSTPELYRRWTELGAFTPIMRTHDGNNRALNHRWDTDPDTTAHFSRFARVHDALRPELEALAAEAEQTGLPIVRHLMVEFPNDPETWPLSDQYLLGSDLLVAPALHEAQEEREVYLPEGIWYDVWTGDSHQGPGWITHPTPIGSPPVFSRGEDRTDLRAIE